MRRQKFTQGMAGGHRSKKDYRLQVMHSGKVLLEEKPITRFQARALAYWWNSITPFGVHICKLKPRT